MKCILTGIITYTTFVAICLFLQILEREIYKCFILYPNKIYLLKMSFILYLSKIYMSHHSNKSLRIINDLLRKEHTSKSYALYVFKRKKCV